MDRKELEIRIKDALILLSDGHPIRVGTLTFGSDKEHFYVVGYTTTPDPKCITKKSASQELNEIKSLFNRMTFASKDLAEFISKRKVEYHLEEDYGMGTINICSEIEGELKWGIEGLA